MSEIRRIAGLEPRVLTRADSGSAGRM